MVYFVGAGSGAVDLITVRGMRLLQKADVIIYAGSLVNPELLGYARKECEIYNSAKMTLDEVIDVMKDAHAKEKELVRLHTGDPSVYGAIREQMDALDELGIEYESCPGVSACFGAASSLNLEYTLPDISQSLIITRMEGKTKVPPKESIESFAAHQASMAIYLSTGMLKELSRRLIAGGYEAATPAAIVYKATWPDEEAYTCTVATLADTAEEHRITKTALVLVGDAITHQHYKKSRLYAPISQRNFVRQKRIYKMKLAIISFTENGITLSDAVVRRADKRNVKLYTKCSHYMQEQESDAPELQKNAGGEKKKGEENPHIQFVEEPLGEWTKQRMMEGNAILFIGACGIAVRAIAPHLSDKLHDVPVLVMDETGQYVIPILAGHVGGANELARYLAAVMEAEAVITTATDLHEKFAVDLFAKKNHLQILNKDGIAKVSAKVLAGETITISIESGHYRESGDTDDSNTKEETNLDQSKTLVDKGQAIRMIDYPPTEKVDVVVAEEPERYDASIYLRPKQYVVGMGCRKDKDSAELMAFYRKTLEQENIEPELVYALASIDKKKEEAGLLAICERKRIPFLVYTAEELSQMNGMFHASSFVETQVGVDNVCERAALAGCGKGGKLIYEKHAQDGMTIAIAKRDWSVGFDEE